MFETAAKSRRLKDQFLLIIPAIAIPGAVATRWVPTRVRISRDRYATTLEQCQHFVAAAGRSALRHSGHVFSGGGGVGAPKTTVP